jgi:hypothetical protein
MLTEKKIGMMIEEELSWLETFAVAEKSNTYRTDIIEADRRIVRMSALYEVLEKVPSDDAQNVVRNIKDKLENAK